MLAEHPSQFLLLEREVEDEYRPRMRQELQRRLNQFAEKGRDDLRIVPVAGDGWFARMSGRFRGGRVSEVCGLACRVTVVRLAAWSAGLSWTC
jgi:hypothetical protein